MSELRFDDRVAIVTGAGGQEPSLGRSHALLLGERGAKVVVNDLGVGPDGRGIMRANAEHVVEQIRAADGEAVADQHSVADEEGARSVVATALDTWGRLDIVVNNAAVCFMVHIDEISSADLRRIIDVHLMGTVWMCRAAWPHMREAGYGRIVNTTSGAMFGIEHLSIYGAAKSGIFGLTPRPSRRRRGIWYQSQRIGTGRQHDRHPPLQRDFAFHLVDGSAFPHQPGVATDLTVEKVRDNLARIVDNARRQ